MGFGPAFGRAVFSAGAKSHRRPPRIESKAFQQHLLLRGIRVQLRQRQLCGQRLAGGQCQCCEALRHLRQCCPVEVTDVV